MKTTKQQITETRNKLAKLEKQAFLEKQNLLKGLPKKLGYNSVPELVAALQRVQGKARANSVPSTTRKRTKITDQLRKKIVKACKQGKKGREMVEMFGVSIPTIHNIKKAAGLTRSRA